MIQFQKYEITEDKDEIRFFISNDLQQSFDTFVMQKGYNQFFFQDPYISDCFVIAGSNSQKILQDIQKNFNISKSLSSINNPDLLHIQGKTFKNLNNFLSQNSPFVIEINNNQIRFNREQLSLFAPNVLLHYNSNPNSIFKLNSQVAQEDLSTYCSCFAILCSLLWNNSNQILEINYSNNLIFADIAKILGNNYLLFSCHQFSKTGQIQFYFIRFFILISISTR